MIKKWGAETYREWTFLYAILRIGARYIAEREEKCKDKEYSEGDKIILEITLKINEVMERNRILPFTVRFEEITKRFSEAFSKTQNSLKENKKEYLDTHFFFYLLYRYIKEIKGENIRIRTTDIFSKYQRELTRWVVKEARKKEDKKLIKTTEKIADVLIKQIYIGNEND